MANLKLPENFSDYDFKSRAKKEPNPSNRIRLIAMANIQEGKTFATIANTLKVHWKSVQGWLARFRKNGMDGLYNQPKSGAPKKLDPAIEQWIVDFINALNAETSGGHITGKQLHALVEEQFGVTCSLKTIYNTLHRLNFSWISARSVHPKSDLEAQAQYKKLSRFAETINTQSC